MNLLSDYPFLALIPPIVSIGLALWSRNIIFSLVMGIITGGVIVQGTLSPWVVFKYSMQALLEGIYDTSSHRLDWGHINLLLFLWMLGGLVYMMQNNGHLAAFSHFVANKFATARGGQLFTFFLGVAVFIDDYFKILAVGSVTRTLCRRVGVSKAKLAYLLDTLAAPLCIITPISSWGATVMTTLASIIATQHITGYTGLSLYFATIAYNFYALFALLLALATILMKSNFGYMQKLEDSVAMPKVRPAMATSRPQGNVYAFLCPIIVLIGVTILTMAITGYYGSLQSSISWLVFMEHANIELSMLVGGVSALLVSYFVARERPGILQAGKHGWEIMWGSVAILVLAWALVHVITDTGLGKYLAGFVVNQTYLRPSLLPIGMFIITAAIAFATGSSWGAFALLLPISSKLAMDSDPSVLVPLLSSCLGGAIFGDHASPISDTSILASTGACCDHMQHIRSQLPYTFLAGGITLISYIVWAVTYSLFISLVIGILMTLVVAYMLKLCYPSKKKK